jgi:ankyrin repeat protein
MEPPKKTQRKEFINAVMRRDRDAVMEMLAERRVNVDMRGRSDRTPLMYASRNGDAQMVIILLNAGATLDLVNNKGETALHMAVAYPNVVSILLKAGADPNIRDGGGFTPLLSAMYLSRFLYKARSVNLLLRAGANPNAISISGFNALRVAIERNYVYTVNILLEYGANPFGSNGKNAFEFAKDISGVSPLILDMLKNATLTGRKKNYPADAKRSNEKINKDFEVVF